MTNCCFSCLSSVSLIFACHTRDSHLDSRSKQSIHKSIHPSICGNLIEYVRCVRFSSPSVCWLALLAARNPNKAGGEMFKRHFIFPIGRSSAVSVSPDDGAPPSSLFRPELPDLRKEHFRNFCHFQEGHNIGFALYRVIILKPSN